MAAHFGSVKPGVEPLGAKLWIGLALRVDQRGDIGEQVGQVSFNRFATACAEVIEADDAAVSFVGAFADSIATPAKFTLSKALTARTEFLDGLGHKAAAGGAFERVGGLNEQGFECIRQLHMLSFKPGRSRS